MFEFIAFSKLMNVFHIREHFLTLKHFSNSQSFFNLWTFFKFSVNIFWILLRKEEQQKKKKQKKNEKKQAPNALCTTVGRPKPRWLGVCAFARAPTPQTVWRARIWIDGPCVVGWRSEGAHVLRLGKTKPFQLDVHLD